MLRARTLLACLGLLAGCAAVGPDYRAPQPELPAAWSQPDTPQPPPAAPDSRWWRRFDDPVLSGLVERALAANPDVRIAAARLRAARAASAQAESLLWPSVGAYGSATRSSSGGQGAVSHYGLGFDASWEIDLFGGLRRGAEAAGAGAQASAATLAATQVSLAAEVARIQAECEKLKAEARKITSDRAYLIITGVSAIATAVSAVAVSIR